MTVRSKKRPGISRNRPPALNQKAAVITLGCAKNQVDSEIIADCLARGGFELVQNPAEADVAIVNTCGFLQSAAQEAIDCILEVAEYKKAGKLKRLIVGGCLVERYKEKLRESLPEVDRFMRVDDIPDTLEFALLEKPPDDHLAKPEQPSFLCGDELHRQIGKSPVSAWLKIADGCNKPCAFCLIPKIRGRMRSRSADSIVREVKELSRQGVQEFNIIAQDLTGYSKHNQNKYGINMQAIPVYLRV